ncbi:OLC1v1031160C1 [Oldenlandia corymbosa var. corymbosa]|uniref:OLC1v1031160C1 n=1 Tax=Oldenlandia corymbosa var. corymbosa TaxID=529605 RepID=A0AAV1CHW1_OLDCO|nr:OLC1v1031160C1 [Oldenlandia corymbosa var. corymbosa]
MEPVTKAAESEDGYAYAKNCFLEMGEKIDTCVGKGKQVEETNRVMPIVKDVAESMSMAPSEIEVELDENKIKGLKPKARITYQTSKRPKNALEHAATKRRNKAKKKDTVVETLQDDKFENNNKRIEVPSRVLNWSSQPLKIFEPNELHFPEVMSSFSSYGRGKQPQFNYPSVNEKDPLFTSDHKPVGFSNHQKTIPCESGSGSSQIYKRNQARLPQKSRGGSKSETEFLFCSRGGILNPRSTSSSKGTAS